MGRAPRVRMLRWSAVVPRTRSPHPALAQAAQPRMEVVELAQGFCPSCSWEVSWCNVVEADTPLSAALRPHGFRREGALFFGVEIRNPARK